MRRLALTCLIAGASALLAACGWTSTASEQSDAAATVDAANCGGSIAVMAPYGGLGADDTVQMNWARVALDKFNQEHGTAFTLTPSNVDAEVDIGVAEAKRLARDPDVIGVVGPKTSVVTRAVGPIFDASDLVYVSPSATNATLTDGSLRNFYRVVASDALQAPTMAEFIGHHLHPSTVLVVRDDEAYSQGLADGLVQRLDELKIPSKVIDITQTQKDFADVVLQVDPTVNVVALPLLDATQATRVVAQLAKAGKYPKVIGGDALFMPSFHAPGAYVTTYAPDSSSEPDAQEMVHLYQSIFGSFEQYGAPSFVAMEVLLDAAFEVCRETGDVTRKELEQQVPKTRLPTSVLGMPIAFTRAHELKDAQISVYQVGPRGFTLQG